MCIHRYETDKGESLPEQFFNFTPYLVLLNLIQKGIQSFKIKLRLKVISKVRITEPYLPVVEYESSPPALRNQH